MEALIHAVSNMSVLGWLQLASLASIALYAVCKLVRRRSRPLRRCSLTPLATVICEKDIKDPSDATGSLSTVSAHSKRPSHSLIRRNTSVSGFSRVVSPLALPTETSSNAAFPSTLKDIDLDTKIKSLADYFASTDAAPSSRFIFRSQQATRLAKLTEAELDEFWIDIQFECLRRAGLFPVHQVLVHCPHLLPSRLEAIERMATMYQPLFVEMVTDLLYELQRRQRRTQAPIGAAPTPPAHATLSRQDIDWKGHDMARFGQLVLEEPEPVVIQRVQDHHHRTPSRRPHRVYLFERIFVAFKEGLMLGDAPTLKGRVYCVNIVKISGSMQNGEYALAVAFAGAQGEAHTDSYTLVFQDEATGIKWATGFRDAVVEAHLRKAVPSI